MTQEKDVTEPAYLTWLKAFHISCLNEFKQLEIEGDVTCEIVTKENRTSLKMQYTDSSGEGPIYNIYLAKRYYGRDMLRVTDAVTGQETVMEAQARLLLAFITF